MFGTAFALFFRLCEVYQPEEKAMNPMFLSTIKKSLKPLAILGLLGLTIPAMGQPGQPGGPQGRGPRGGRAFAGRPFAGAERPGFMKSAIMARLAHGQFGPQKGGFSGKQLLLPQVREKLGITDDQAKKIETLAYTNEKQAIDLEAKVKQAELDLKQSMTQKRPDKNKVLAQVDTVSKAKADLAKLKVSEHLGVREILTDAQVEKIEKFIKSQHRGGPRGPMMHGGRGFGGRGGHEGFGGRGQHGFRGGRGSFGGPRGPMMGGQEGFGGPRGPMMGGGRGFRGGRGGFGGPALGAGLQRPGAPEAGAPNGPMIGERIQQRLQGMRDRRIQEMRKLGQPEGAPRPGMQPGPQGAPQGRPHPGFGGGFNPPGVTGANFQPGMQGGFGGGFAGPGQPGAPGMDAPGQPGTPMGPMIGERIQQRIQGMRGQRNPEGQPRPEAQAAPQERQRRPNPEAQGRQSDAPRDRKPDAPRDRKPDAPRDRKPDAPPAQP